MIIYEKRTSTILFNILKSLNKDKRFLIPSNICPIVVATFLKAKIPYEFVDISTESLCIDHKLILKKIKSHPDTYGGVVFVRTYGVMDIFEEVFKQIKEVDQDILVIDDACLTIPRFEEPNTNADLILFSTGYSKFIDLGFGGYAILNKKIYYKTHILPYNEKCLLNLVNNFRRIEKNPIKFKYEDCGWLDSSKPSINFGEYKTMVKKQVPKVIEAKKHINRIYTENLPKEIQLPSKFQTWRFNILVPKKDLLLKKIFKAGLFASSHYQSLSNIFGNSGSKNAEKLHATVINLFNDFRFNANQAIRITEVINTHLNSN